MLKRFGGSRLNSGMFEEEEDVNPTSYIPNLADAFLVLAVGCMLALVINWNVNLGNGSATQVDTTELSEVKNYDNISKSDLTKEISKAGLQENGTVYTDPSTGKLYVVVKEK